MLYWLTAMTSYGRANRPRCSMQQPVLTYQRCFRVSTALIPFIYLRTRTWSGKIRLLIVIAIALGVGFVELLCLFNTGSLDLIKGGSVHSRTELSDALAATKLLSTWILLPSTSPALTHCATT
jgi:hypothetical protein